MEERKHNIGFKMYFFGRLCFWLVIFFVFSSGLLLEYTILGLIAMGIAFLGDYGLWSERIKEERGLVK